MGIGGNTTGVLSINIAVNTQKVLPEYLIFNSVAYITDRRHVPWILRVLCLRARSRRLCCGPGGAKLRGRAI